MTTTEEAHTDDTKRSHGSTREGMEDEPVTKVGWFKRLKGSLTSRLTGGLVAAITRLQGLKTRLGGGDDESEDRSRARPPHPAPRPESPPSVTPEQSQKKPGQFRKFLTFAVLIIASLGLGAGGAYTFFSKLLKDQSLAIDNHEQEIRAFQLEELEQEKKMADLLRKLETEQKLRADMETRLVEVEQQRLAAEAKLKSVAPEVSVGKVELPRNVEHPATKKETEPDTKAVVSRPSKASTFRPPANGNCNLAGSDPASLKRCIEDYNRK